MIFENYKEYYENNTFEVLTDTGYQDFKGLLVTDTNSTVKIITTKTEIECTLDHKIYYCEDSYKLAKDFCVGDTIMCEYGIDFVVGVAVYNKSVDVYDLLHVSNGHRYYNSLILNDNCCYLDEFAWVENDNEFYTSTYPTVSSGKNSKIIITSTPNGLNLFYKIFTEAKNLENSYKAYHVHWNEHPDRDQKWADAQIANTSPEKFAVEFGCAFLGSSGTLIKGTKLEHLTHEKPISTSDDGTMAVYAEPVEGRVYVSVCDCAEGGGGDASAMIVVDITETPFKVVLRYADNTISPTNYASVINAVSLKYNNALCVVENNSSSGAIVCRELWFEHEYENLLKTKVENSENKAGGAKTKVGVSTTKKTKSVGCTTLKGLIENDVLLPVDIQAIQELSTFVKVNNSYQAEKNKKDDVVMCMVIFAWLTTQDYFNDLTDADAKSAVAEVTSDDYTHLLGFVSNGITTHDPVEYNITVPV